MFFKNTGAAKFQHVQNFGEVSKISHFALHFNAPYFSVIKKYSERSVFLPFLRSAKIKRSDFLPLFYRFRIWQSGRIFL
ncbi:MAG: hypothetical protein B6245_00715 [Desulfobacteraceae bacterium 4572_88]|nr:MAG: hypothetical protein B6245_00715 [Desulfobacteraceae bacterium 4572_88]